MSVAVQPIDHSLGYDWEGEMQRDFSLPSAKKRGKLLFDKTVIDRRLYQRGLSLMQINKRLGFLGLTLQSRFFWDKPHIRQNAQ